MERLKNMVLKIKYTAIWLLASSHKEDNEKRKRTRQQV
jgi:hypothetical protein